MQGEADKEAAPRACRGIVLHFLCSSDGLNLLLLGILADVARRLAAGRRDAVPEKLTMPVTYHIDKATNILFAKASGELTAEDIQVFRRAAVEDPDFDPHLDTIFDFLDITGLQLSGDEVRELTHSAIFHERSRRALVVPSKVMFGVSRMYSLYIRAESDVMKVFYDMKDARRWLGLEQPT